MSILPKPAFCAFVICSAAALLTSCSVYQGTDRDEDPLLQRELDSEADYRSESGFSFWNDEPGDGPLSVTIDLSEQTAWFKRGSITVGKSRVATGRKGHRTPRGRFAITEKTADKRSNLYGKIYDASGAVVTADADTRRDSVPPGGKYVGAAMPYWMRLTSSGIGMHAGPIPNPGLPASHGCIRMPRAMAAILFEHAPIGTPVRIVR